MALNGGSSFVYLRNKEGHWADRPVFERDVLPVAKAFWDAHDTGAYASEIKGALAGVLLRNVAKGGWDAPFEALTPNGEIISLESWFAQQPEGLYTDPVNRLRDHVSKFTGDLYLISNYAEGYYFGGETTGVHGGLHPEDSLATLIYSWPGGPETDWTALAHEIRSAIDNRCKTEGERLPATCDVIYGIESVIFNE
jgi:hypothetical protein